MWGSDSAVYGLKYGGRCIVAQSNPLNMMGDEQAQKAAAATNSSSNDDSDSDSDLGIASKHYFLLGTTSLREQNEVHQVEYNEETGDLRCTAVYGHPDEIWHLAPNPHDASLLCTTHTDTTNGDARRVGTLWRFPTEAPPSESPLTAMPLEKVCSVPNGGSGSSTFDTVDFVWETHDGSSGGRCLSVARDGLRMMSLEGGALRINSTILVRDAAAATEIGGGSSRSSRSSSRSSVDTAFMTGFSHGRWDPHHVNEIAASAGGDVYGYDLRQPNSSSPSHWIQGAHSQVVYDLDYNPNKPYCLMTCGDDCLIRFWDLRKVTTGGGAGEARAGGARAGGARAAASQPIAVLRNHTHWVRTSKYNPFHDQLVLSAGSDAAVDLWRISSISSAPLLEMDGDDDDDRDDDDDDDDDNDCDKNDDDDDDDDNDDDSNDGHLSQSRRNRRASETALDTLITRFDEAHEESVYSVAWSVAEAWTFASLSHDGRMVVNTVPSAEKYKILL
jgi:WD40 repeat protein